MSGSHHRYLTDSLFFFYAVFIFGSTFSIALAQIALGLALIVFIATMVVTRHDPLAPSLRRFYLFVGLYILWMLISALAGATPGRSVFILKEDWLFCIVPIGVFLFQNERYRND